MEQIFHKLTRREMLKTATCGFGGLALSGMQYGQTASYNSLIPKTSLFPQRAKRVIFIFMAGGPSHVDTFDYKPELFAKDGKQIDFVGVRTNTFGKASKRTLMKPLWEFKRYGECGQYVSSCLLYSSDAADE